MATTNETKRRSINVPATTVEAGDRLCGPGAYDGQRVEATHTAAPWAPIVLHLECGAEVEVDREEMVTVEDRP